MIVEGVGPVAEDSSPSFYHGVTPGYFRAVRAPLRAGRDFLPNEADAVIVNGELARRLWGGSSPLGHRLRFGDGPASRWYTVVGVTSVRNDSPLAARGDRPTAYVPLRAVPGANISIIAGTDGAAAALVPEIKAAAAAIDPDQPIENLMTMEQMYAEWTSARRMVTGVLGSLAGVAMLMAAMGTFSVVAYAVSRRTREIGIRLALGATPRQVQRHMAGAGLKLAAAGLACGVAAAWLSTRTLEGILAGTSPTDPIVFGTVSVVLALVAFCASWLPARRAARVDPLMALRAE